MSGIEYARYKTMRAKQHLDQLNRQIEAFINSKPYTFSKKDDLRQNVHIVTIELKPVPYNIGVVTGDFAYCMRSALDQLAWQLALTSTPKPFSKTCFPIYSDNSRGRFEKVTRSIPIEAAAIIESLQPYKGGTAPEVSALADLDQLCNTDKHRIIPIHSLGIQVIDINPPNKAVRKDLKYGVQMIFPLSDKPNITFNPQIPDFVFGDPIDTPGGARFEFPRIRLTEIYDLICDKVIPRFTRFFE
ncbi:hypothetical protein MYX82_11535 [Acidobacteria bacterium AH-259-D05]|nr:hypothetical protein [Acidobacteria bacterium AH-259-D05]